MEVTQPETIKATLAGAQSAAALETFNPEAEARALLELMGRSGILPSEIVNGLLTQTGEIIDADVIPAIELRVEETNHE
jgi:hypothetical protein